LSHGSSVVIRRTAEVLTNHVVAFANAFVAKTESDAVLIVVAFHGKVRDFVAKAISRTISSARAFSVSIAGTILASGNG